MSPGDTPESAEYKTPAPSKAMPWRTMEKSREEVQRIVDEFLKDHPEGGTIKVQSVTSEGFITTIQISVRPEQVVWLMGPNEQVVDFESGLRENLRKSLLAVGIISKNGDRQRAI